MSASFSPRKRTWSRSQSHNKRLIETEPRQPGVAKRPRIHGGRHQVLQQLVKKEDDEKERVLVKSEPVSTDDTHRGARFRWQNYLQLNHQQEEFDQDSVSRPDPEQKLFPAHERRGLLRHFQPRTHNTKIALGNQRDSEVWAQPGTVPSIEVDCSAREGREDNVKGSLQSQVSAEVPLVNLLRQEEQSLLEDIRVFRGQIASRYADLDSGSAHGIIPSFLSGRDGEISGDDDTSPGDAKSLLDKGQSSDNDDRKYASSRANAASPNHDIDMFKRITPQPWLAPQPNTDNVLNTTGRRLFQVFKMEAIDTKNDETDKEDDADDSQGENDHHVEDDAYMYDDEAGLLPTLPQGHISRFKREILCPVPTEEGNKTEGESQDNDSPTEDQSCEHTSPSSSNLSFGNSSYTYWSLGSDSGDEAEHESQDEDSRTENHSCRNTSPSSSRLNSVSLSSGNESSSTCCVAGDDSGNGDSDDSDDPDEDEEDDGDDEDKDNNYNNNNNNINKNIDLAAEPKILIPNEPDIARNTHKRLNAMLLLQTANNDPSAHDEPAQDSKRLQPPACITQQQRQRRHSGIVIPQDENTTPPSPLSPASAVHGYDEYRLRARYLQQFKGLTAAQLDEAGRELDHRARRLNSKRSAYEMALHERAFPRY